MLCYQAGPFKDHLVIFTEQRHFYLYRVNDDLTTELVKRYPSKHMAHSVLELNYDGGLLTVSTESLEFWDLCKQKRKRLLGNCYGSIQYCCKLLDKQLHLTS